jgi:squalene-hopene/tetraprenyl-beta-curcumene cyclase
LAAPDDRARATLDDAITGACRHLAGLQDPAGWWKGELETNVTMDAEDLLMRHFLGILDPDVAGSAADWILANQRGDGTWATFLGGPADMSTTVEAYVALRLAGHQPDDPRLSAAGDWVRTHGGLASTRVFTRIWLALVGQWSWSDLPVIPPEIMYLPPSVPLNIYDFACWARQTVVALTIVFSHRPARPLPFELEELRAAPSGSPTGPPLRGAARWLQRGDDLLRHYEHLPRWFAPRNALRRSALAKAERWILQRQEADGLWGGIQPPVVYSIIALHLQGYRLDHPVMKAALAGLESFTIRDRRGRRLEACQSPVWDTALAVIGLVDSGVRSDDPDVAAALAWLLDEEIDVVGDWAVRRPGLSPGGWAFEFANDNYPDIDDTALVVLALRQASRLESGPEPSPPPTSGEARGDRSGQPAGDRLQDGPGSHDGPDSHDLTGLLDRIDGACGRAVAWTVGMQCSDGGWGAFDADNVSRLVSALPFCDFGEVTDPPSADVTAHVVEMLAGETGVEPAVLGRAVDWLWAHQEPDGSWFGRWGVNHVYGTGAVVPALVAAGVDPTDARIGRAVGWLEDHQNPDGGWGEDLRSYRDDTWRGRGESTPSQTAWALMALIAAGRAASEACARGVGYLVDTQEESGTWDEPWFTGTGFPWDFSINYHLYRLVWPLSALGRYRGATAP